MSFNTVAPKISKISNIISWKCDDYSKDDKSDYDTYMIWHN